MRGLFPEIFGALEPTNPFYSSTSSANYLQTEYNNFSSRCCSYLLLVLTTRPSTMMAGMQIYSPENGRAGARRRHSDRVALRHELLSRTARNSISSLYILRESNVRKDEIAWSISLPLTSELNSSADYCLLLHSIQGLYLDFRFLCTNTLHRVFNVS